MMIIYAHPNRDGHCGAILKEVEESLSQKKEKYEILDLYKIKYNPVLLPEEHYTSGHYEVSEENKKIQEKIKNENRFVFIYPTWWNSTPAILKGFIDRIFVSRFAFKYINNIPRGLLKGKAAVFTTTGSPKIIYNILLGRRSLKAMCRDSLKFCGIKAKGFTLCKSRKFDESKIKKIRKLVKKGLGYLN